MSDPCMERSLNEFAYKSAEDIAWVEGGLSTIIGVAAKLAPHPAVKLGLTITSYVAAGIGVAAGWAASHFRSEYDRLESACPKQPDGSYQPTSPPPDTGIGGEGQVYGPGAVSGPYVPKQHWEWVPQSTYDDGADESISWLSSNDGILIYDFNNNGIGETVEWNLTSFVSGALTDFEALQAFDSNQDGVVNSADPIFAKLKVGIDTNEDGEIGASELHPLSDYKIASFITDSESVLMKERDGSIISSGVLLDATSYAIQSNGGQTPIASVGFVQQIAPSVIYEDVTGIIMATGPERTLLWGGNSGTFFLGSFSYGGITGFSNFSGSDGNDIVFGTISDNLMIGNGSVDSLYGGDGNDTFVVDADGIYLGQIFGDGDRDIMIVSTAVAGAISLERFADIEMFVGSHQNDNFQAANRAAVTVFGGGGDDYILGSSYNDVLTGNDGADYLHGGLGNDLYVFGKGSDIESVTHTGGNDILKTTFSSGQIHFSWSGNDILVSSSGNERVYLVDGRLNAGVETVALDDHTFSREDINMALSALGGRSASFGGEAPMISATDLISWLG